MITSMKIEKLFGRFNYDFVTKEGGVTIITGPNGYGKSTILQIIEAISNKDLHFFINLEFQRINCFFDNENCAKIIKYDDSISVNDNNISIREVKTLYGRDFQRKRSPYIRRIGQNELLDTRTGQIITPEEIGFFTLKESDLSELLDLRGIGEKDKARLLKVFEVLNNISDWSGKTRLISDQRIIKRRYNRAVDEVENAEAVIGLPYELKEIISRVSSDYSTQANILDSTYPSRLLKSTADDEIDETAYKDKLKEAQGKFEKLKLYNLADLSLLEDGSFDSKYATALKIYFDDFFSKYLVFEDLIIKLDLFTSILNGRLKFKQITILRTEGFIVKDLSVHDKILDINKLSSGEKQEILLFFDLIFNTNNDLLLLIDEPELSLHVSWQQQFLDDLLKVTNINRLQVIIATHSPQIIGSHRDIQIDLGELYNEQ